MKWICLILIVLGLVISLYLLHSHIALTGQSAGGSRICKALFGADCNAALRSPTAIQLGIPLAGWGVIYYLTLAASLVLGWTLGETFEFEAKIAALVLSLIASLAGLALVGAMLLGQSPICPLCIAVHFINFLLVFSFFRLTSRTIPQLLSTFVAAFEYFLKGKTAHPVMARWKLLGFLTLALITGILYQGILIEARLKRTAGTAYNPQQVLATFESGTQHDIPITQDDSIFGSKSASVQLTVFSDFQCSACRQFSDEIADLLEQFEGKLSLVFKHFPLSMVCNASVNINLHPQACEAALAAEAARQQGKFWDFHDALFTSNLNPDENTVRLIAKELGLNLAQFEADRVGEAAIAKVESDIKLAIRLGVDYTPAIFLNGRLVRDTRPQSLQLLIAHEIEHGTSH